MRVSVVKYAIIEDESEYYNYLASSRTEKDKSLYNKDTINIVNLDEIKKN